MSDVRVRHNPIVITNDCFALILSCSSVDGAELSNGIVIANDKLGVLIVVFFILRCLAYGGTMENFIVKANRGIAGDRDAITNNCVLAYRNACTDNGIWPNSYIVANVSLFMNDGGGMYIVL